MGSFHRKSNTTFFEKIPEGLVTAIPEMEVLIEEIDALYVEHAGPESSSNTLSREEVQERLTVWSKALLASLPAFIQEEVRCRRKICLFLGVACFFFL